VVSQYNPLKLLAFHARRWYRQELGHDHIQWGMLAVGHVCVDSAISTLGSGCILGKQGAPNTVIGSCEVVGLVFKLSVQFKLYTAHNLKESTFITKYYFTCPL
jgi:hypothetical protein